jgi:hypothetical protein
MSTRIDGITPRYFETLGIPLLAGRMIEGQDVATSARVAVVNQALSRRFFPDGNAIGQYVELPMAAGEFEIVGIVGDTRETSPNQPPYRMLYIPPPQMPSDGPFGSFLEVRTDGAPGALIAELRKALAGSIAICRSPMSSR